ncbi:MAG: carbohydrate-binding family 9-like protein [bacterium]|nr:carbohydrate-binding family 9-like protein [bacterium]
MQQFKIENYPWGGGYRPKTTANLSWNQEEGFEIWMRCEEEEVRATYTKSDEPVYEDSCMECFMQFFPCDSKIYINFEVNANGAMLAQMGEGKQGRMFLRDKGIEIPKVSVKREKGAWELRYRISLELLRAVYGRADFVKGQKIRGNFYKCGDRTKKPHYGCCFAIENETPNFHLPQFFGEIVIQ